MDIKELVERVSNKDNFCNSAGYHFLFMDPDKTIEPYITTLGRSKVCGAGAHFGYLESYMSVNEVNLSFLKDSDKFDRILEHDLLLAGSLKSLLPELNFGGSEIFFEVWMFVKTPEDKFLPLTFYYGGSGTSFGGWTMSDLKETFSSKFLHVVNCNPFTFGKEELERLVQAHILVLKKFPVSDFHGVFTHDLGNSLMGVRNGEPFIEELGFDYDESDIEDILEILDINFEYNQRK